MRIDRLKKYGIIKIKVGVRNLGKKHKRREKNERERNERAERSKKLLEKQEQRKKESEKYLQAEKIRKEEEYKNYLEKRKKIERQEIEREKEKFEGFPFCKLRKIIIKTGPERFQKGTCGLSFTLEEKVIGSFLSIYGMYRAGNNTLYIDVPTQNRIISYMKKNNYEVQNLLMHPVCKKWTNAPTIKVSVFCGNESAPNARQMNESHYKSLVIPSTPKFTKEIAAVLIRINDVSKIVRILKDVGKDDRWFCTSGEILVREMELLGRELLGRLAHKSVEEFVIKNERIKIIQYKIWEGKEYYLQGFTKFIDTNDICEIFLMSQKTLRKIDDMEYEMVTALIYCENREEPVYIDVYYSKKQDRYFINSESYVEYSKRYGLPYVKVIPEKTEGEMDYGTLRQHSELNLYGYSVAKTAAMTVKERQRLLKQLLDTSLMSKHQIVNHLEWLIHSHDGRDIMEDACECWKEDLRFVNSYKINRQRLIRGKFVYGNMALNR